MTDDVEGIGEYFNKQGYRHKQGQYLNVETVIQIFAMLSCDIPVSVIGGHFGVSSQMVYHIKNGNRWGWVRDELMRPTDDKRLKHSWIPDVRREGKFVCYDCGMRYDQLMMNTTCPVRSKNADGPIYLSWEMPKPKKPKVKRQVAGADLKGMRWYKSKVDKEKEKFEQRQERRRKKLQEKEDRRQQLLREVEELRKKEEREKVLAGKNFSLRDG